MVWINVQNAVAQQKSFELVYRIHTRNRQVRWVRDLGSCTYPSLAKQPLLEGFITDITDWKLAEEKIQSQVRRFQALRAIDNAISAGPDLQITLGILLEQIISQVNVDAAAILLHQMGTPLLEYASCRGFRTQPPLRAKAYIGRGFAGIAALTQKTIHIPDLSISVGMREQQLPIEAEDFKVYYGIPLLAKGQVKGVLEVFLRSPTSLDQDRQECLEAMGGQAAIAIDNSSLFEQLQDTNTELTIAYDATLEGWARALEMRDRETEGHAHRVIEMTLAMADRIGIQGEMLQNIRRGALLHDIGKMGIPDTILLKPGPLTPSEWEVMRQHPQNAYEMLKPIEYLSSAMEIPYCHHEKWDGSGYPRGLKGRDIPISARIFAVVDVWDALTSNRPYRSAWTARHALEYIQRESGRHFDPQMVEAFLHQ
jgi:response regulator RpfG family c-di-GMP phosphodiesterase